eukprot:scaffold113977_cov28-Tisochrysis_lutea.AAC.2
MTAGDERAAALFVAGGSWWLPRGYVGGKRPRREHIRVRRRQTPLAAAHVIKWMPHIEERRHERPLRLCLRRGCRPLLLDQHTLCERPNLCRIVWIRCV